MTKIKSIPKLKNSCFKKTITRKQVVHVWRIPKSALLLKIKQNFEIKKHHLKKANTSSRKN